MIYISPPFGQYFNPKNTTPILGSYTLHPRPGRFIQILKTFRKIKGGWVNSIGLRNPGINSLKYQPKIIYSIAGGIEPNDWEKIYEILAFQNWPEYNLELNLSCPNIDKIILSPLRKTLELFSNLPNSKISAKLPPNLHSAQMFTEMCLISNINLIHLSNTFPSYRGGISGKILRDINLPIIDYISKTQPKAEIIAGGGIYNLNHAKQYFYFGAKHFSLATVFLNPIRGYRLIQKINKFI